MFRTLLHKELREQWRTWRFIIMVVVLVISGLISPLLAYYTPALLRLVPDMPAGLAGLIPDPTVNDAVVQYVKNVSQFGVLLVILLTMGSVAQEVERGTLALLLTRPVRRSAVILAKWLVWAITLFSGLAVGGLMGWIYTLILFEPLPVIPFIQLNLLLFIFLLVYMSVTLLASALARSQAVAAGGAFIGLILLLVLSSLPRLGDYMPGQLNAWGSALVSGAEGAAGSSAWSALWISLAIILLSLIIACLRLEGEEI
jgi:ABC-2 type transport system permease protein